MCVYCDDGWASRPSPWVTELPAPLFCPRAEVTAASVDSAVSATSLGPDLQHPGVLRHGDVGERLSVWVACPWAWAQCVLSSPVSPLLVFMLHCPIRLHLQNINSKIKLLRIQNGNCKALNQAGASSESRALDEWGRRPMKLALSSVLLNTESVKYSQHFELITVPLKIPSFKGCCNWSLPLGRCVGGKISFLC